tara:strand:+ start:547 stop:675 length:129 start_codon:yes stop_codon:yes gene_type:complete
MNSSGQQMWKKLIRSRSKKINAIIIASTKARDFAFENSTIVA